MVVLPAKECITMPNLPLRRLDDDTLHWLRSRAASHGQSVNAEILDLLRVARADELAEGSEDNPFAASYRKARARGIRTPGTAQDIVRADRDAR
jgi:plasmid stability protein